MDTKKKNSDNKRIWTYAVVLFTGAFAVLLVTAFSQIKLNQNTSEYKKNISEYKNQLSNVEKKKVSFEINLNTALEENKALLKKIDEMKKDIAAKNKELNNYKTNTSNTKNAIAKSKHAYEVLLEAENLFRKNDIIGSAEILHKQCEPSLLDEKGLTRYKSLVDKTFYNAALKLYFQGYKNYKEQKYDTAIKDLQAAVDLQPNEYFSDDCYYFIAYSFYKKGNKSGFNQAANALLTRYPQSTYIDEINRLLKEINIPG